MKRANYDVEASAEAVQLIQSLFGLGGVGYVALDWNGEPIMRVAPGLVTDTTPETNFFEEYLLNPSILFIAKRRGALDCGGLRYIALGYGDFIQVLIPITEGHVSIGVAKTRDVEALVGKVATLLSDRDSLTASEHTSGE